jgi:type IV pilus biogenesis protein PilP
MDVDTKVAQDLVVFNATQANMTDFNTNNTNAFTQSANGTNGTGIPIGNPTNSTNATPFSFGESAFNGMNKASVQSGDAPTDLTNDNLKDNSTEKLTNKPISKNNKIVPSEATITPLSYFTSLRSELELKKLEVAIAEQNQKLTKLYTPDPAVIKAVQQKPAKKKHYRPVWPKIVSIQGVDGRLSATLSSSSGVQTVKIGSNAGPGKVASITPSTVLIRFNGKNVPLKFKE